MLKDAVIADIETRLNTDYSTQDLSGALPFN